MRSNHYVGSYIDCNQIILKLIEGYALQRSGEYLKIKQFHRGAPARIQVRITSSVLGGTIEDLTRRFEYISDMVDEGAMIKNGVRSSGLQR